MSYSGSNTNSTTNVGGTHFSAGSQAAVSAHVHAAEEQRTADGGKLFSPDFFMDLMARFFITFSADGGSTFLYKDFIIDLMPIGLIDGGDEVVYRDDMGGRVHAFTLELSHLKKFDCWDVKGESLLDEMEKLLNNDTVSDGVSTMVADGELPKFMHWADNLYQCFRDLPIKYVPFTELVVKKIFKALTRRELPQFQLELADATIQAKTIRTLHPDTDMHKLVYVPGIVIGASKVYVKSSKVVARCKKCRHVTTLVMPIWREGGNLPKLCQQERQSNESNKEDQCPLNPYEVVTEFTTFLETQIIKFQERPEDIPIGDIPRSISLYAAGVHVRDLNSGNRKYILGIYSNFDSGLGSVQSDHAAKSISIHLMGIFKDPDDYISQNDDDQGSQLTPEFSQKEINSFRTFAKRADLVEVVSNSIAPSIYGHHDVKRSIACMLFGGTSKAISKSNRNRADIHILLLGDPSVAKSQFLRFACNVAPRGVYTSGKGSSAAGLTASIVKDSQGNFALEGGAMVLADQGIVCIDEFDKMRDDDRVAIHEAMEQQTISIAKAGITTVLGTKCAVLSAANPSFGSFDMTKDTAEQHDFETTILSRFDLIWLIRDEKNYEKDRKIASHIFNLFLDAGRVTKNIADEEKELVKDLDGNEIMSIEFLKKYLLYAKTNVAPRLTKSGATRLESYYVEIRNQQRQSTTKKVDQIPITVRQLESLIRLAEALAKMHLSSEVQADHVTEAIRLFGAATVTASQSSHVREVLTEEERDLVAEAEEAILRRVAINARISKFTLCKDLMMHGYPSKWAQFAVVTLIKKGKMRELRDNNILRVS